MLDNKRIMALPDGPVRLRTFLQQHSISLREAAATLGVSHITIRGWCRRQAKPREPVRAALERWTGGAVPAESWLTRREQIELRRLSAIGRCSKLDAAA